MAATILGCCFADWSIRLEDPEAIRVFYRWLDHPSCGRRLVSYVGALYDLHGLEWSYDDFADELREHSRRVPKLKYDIWDTCASWLLRISDHSSFLRLALGFTYYLRPQVDEEEASGGRSFFFHDPGIKAVFTAILENLRDAVAAEKACAEQQNRDEQHLAPCPAQLELLRDRVSRRSCSVVTGEVDMGVPGAFLEEKEFVCELLFSFFSSSEHKHTAVLLSWWERSAKEKKFEGIPSHRDILGMFFVTHAKISSPLPPERIKSFIERCRKAQLNLRPGMSWGTVQLNKLVLKIARGLLESRGHDNGARVNRWLRNGSAMLRRRVLRIHSKVVQVEPAAKEMAFLYTSWCKSRRGKEKIDRLLQPSKESLPELLRASDCLLGPEYVVSLTNLITAIGPELETAEHSSDAAAAAAQHRALLEAIRLKALDGEYQILRPRGELNSQDASVNELVLRLLEDVLDEEQGVRGFVDLPAIHRTQLKLDIGQASTGTIVARKEVGAEIANLVAALTGRPEVKVRDYCTSREQEYVFSCLLRFRVGPPFVEVDAPPFIPEEQMELCKKAASVWVFGTLCGVEITAAVRGMIKDLVDGLALLEVEGMEESSLLCVQASEGGVNRESLCARVQEVDKVEQKALEKAEMSRKRLYSQLVEADVSEADLL